MLIVNSAWPFATVRGPGFTGCVCVCTVNSHTLLNFSIRVLSLFLCNNACDAGNMVFHGCVREFNSSHGRCSHRVAEAGGVDHRLPWQPEGKPFHPAGGISCQGRVKQPENPSLHPLYRDPSSLESFPPHKLSFGILWLPFLSLSLSTNLIVPTHFIHHKSTSPRWPSDGASIINNFVGSS